MNGLFNIYIGAIMFNDPLTKRECTDLVRRLADCAFPFQCAHGRPSMVPLLDLNNIPLGRTAPEDEVSRF